MCLKPVALQLFRFALASQEQGCFSVTKVQLTKIFGIIAESRSRWFTEGSHKDPQNTITRFKHLSFNQQKQIEPEV